MISPGPWPSPPALHRWRPEESNARSSPLPRLRTTIVPSLSLVTPSIRWNCCTNGVSTTPRVSMGSEVNRQPSPGPHCGSAFITIRTPALSVMSVTRLVGGEVASSAQPKVTRTSHGTGSCHERVLGLPRLRQVKDNKKTEELRIRICLRQRRLCLGAIPLLPQSRIERLLRPKADTIDRPRCYRNHSASRCFGPHRTSASDPRLF